MSDISIRLREAAKLVGRARFSDAAAALLQGEAARAPLEPPAPTRFESFVHEAADGRRPYKLFVPGGRPRAAPLLVMMHGCAQTPDDFALSTRMNAHAERLGWYVAYPGQIRAANASGCWNWFEARDQERGRGEPGLIAGIVEEVAARAPIDRRRVFIAGLSAGGAAAATLGALYPELFAAIGVHSGLACGAARDMRSAFVAMQRSAPGRALDGRPVPTIVFHGDRDATVNPGNGGHVIAQMRAGAPLRERREEGMAGGRTFIRAVHEDARGRVVLEHWLVQGGAHAWFGGEPGAAFSDPMGPDASAEMLRFFSAAVS